MPLLATPKIDLKRGPAPRVNVIAVLIFLLFFLPGLGLTIYMNSPVGIVVGALGDHVLPMAPPRFPAGSVHVHLMAEAASEISWLSAL